MRVLAIGATGFLGTRVVRILTSGGNDLAVLHRGETAAGLPDPVQHIFGDRNVLRSLRPAIQRFAPDVVLHVIPYTERQARDLVDTCRGLCRRIVVVSSADVYRNYEGFLGHPTAAPDPIPLSEQAPLRETRYPYRGRDLPFPWSDAYDKVLVERVVMEAPVLSGTVLRLPAVYGPGDRRHRFYSFLKCMNEGNGVIHLEEAQARWR